MTRLAVGLALVFAVLGAIPAQASDDDTRNAMARKDCVRGTFHDYYLHGQGGDPPSDYRGPVYKLSQDYPSQLPPIEDYPG
jgi:hypothetical protein